MTNDNHSNINDANNGKFDIQDAVYRRFREKRDTPDLMFCHSCCKEFQSTSILEVIDHYGQNKHNNFSSLCLYCKGTAKS